MRQIRNLWFWLWFGVAWVIWQCGLKEIRKAFRISYDRIEARDFAMLCRRLDRGDS